VKERCLLLVLDARESHGVHRLPNKIKKYSDDSRQANVAIHWRNSGPDLGDIGDGDDRGRALGDQSGSDHYTGHQLEQINNCSLSCD